MLIRIANYKSFFYRRLCNLSGGEKTLSSMALHQYKSTPLYFMDEIDTALEFKNVSIVANYVKSRTKDAQFVVISLRNNMFELANQLVDIYKTHDCSKSITIDPKKFHLPFTNQNKHGSNPLTQPLVATTQIVSTYRSGAQKSFTTPYAKLKCNIKIFFFFVVNYFVKEYLFFCKLYETNNSAIQSQLEEFPLVF
ncbi:hypothetical protein RFI_29836 [Reticulomyxa filosa]|uniref:RecF/RecN/SMC N-terminal domain-containing protein n=1 Tax=Reticulomyxa filosa TaxID=46433 RepID=X6M1S3_RETFI|nr:hypothetical protein RFI_29836 [Reticulomyxa filosa]|eukprot:ETO07556.1 hypothetical protein RFI_29836 [Reticulomyxa filosa]